MWFQVKIIWIHIWYKFNKLSSIFIIIIVTNLNAILDVVFYSDFSKNAVLEHA